MNRLAAGYTCRIFIDTPPDTQPRRGEYVVTIRKLTGKRSSAYLILRSVEVHRRTPCVLRRFNLVCVRVPVDEVTEPFHSMTWYARSRRIRAR